jgi:hemoglobin
VHSILFTQKRGKKIGQEKGPYIQSPFRSVEKNESQKGQSPFEAKKEGMMKTGQKFLIPALLVSALFGLVATLFGCAGATSQSPSRASAQPAISTSLYERLGAKPAITAVVDDFVGRVAADTRINGKFANADIPRLKQMLVDQICQASGGPCTYTGRDMKTAHAGMQITGDQFDALVQDLVAALDKFKVGKQEKGELLSVLGPMKRDIVTAM